MSCIKWPNRPQRLPSYRKIALPVLLLLLVGCVDDPVMAPSPKTSGTLRLPPASVTAASGSATVSVVSSGDYHTCVLSTTGAIRCWGNNYWGQNNVPGGVFEQVSSGRGHACGLTSGGSIQCWGANGYGQLNVPAGTFTQVAAAERFTCALRDDGAILCWGYNSHGQTSVPSGTFTQISSSLAHGCAITTSSAVKCWGFNDYRQANAPAGTFSQVSAGIHHSCAVRDDGSVTCWGGDYGQLIAPPGSYRHVSAGWKHNCALTTAGQVRCWGDNTYGQSNAPSGTFTQVAAGEYHTCARNSAGTVQCWGNNYWSQNNVPNGSYADVSGGESFTCAVTLGGALGCWGYPNGGQTNPPPTVFTHVSTGESVTCAIGNVGTVRCWGYILGQLNAPKGVFQRVSVGFGHACALTPAGALRCWGSNGNGQLNVPAETFTDFAVGAGFTCGLTSTATIRCWGYNSHGQVAAPSGSYSEIDVLLAHGCARSPTGSVKCWGFNDYGQANGPTTGTFRQVSAGVHHSCAVRDDGSVTCWGGDYGQLVAPPGSYRHVSAGWKHNCALTSVSTVTCWGSNEYGQASVPEEFRTPPVGMVATGVEVGVKPLDTSTGQPSGSVSLVFDNVVSGGQVMVTAKSTGTPPPTGFRLGTSAVHYEVTPSAELTFIGNVEVCIDYTGQVFNGSGPLQILHSHLGQPTVPLPVSRHDPVAEVVCGLTDRFSEFTVAQSNVAPVAAATASPGSGVTEGSAVAFDASGSSDEDGSIVRYEWDWENDGTFDAGGVTASHVFAQDGTYRVVLRVTDNDGGMHVTTVDIAVANALPSVTVSGPLDPIALTSGTAVASIWVSATDPGSFDPHVVTVACGDGRIATGSPLTCTYTAAGVYGVVATVTDDDGYQSASFDFVVVYDPNGGFLTGGGWINSPAGAYVADPSLTGKANFGFVSKYQQGKTVPQGNTEFQFHAGNLNFKSTVYEWLVVAGDRAQFKGDGMINGVDGYGFLLTGIDGIPDKFRIKIVRKSDGSVIYDNQSGYSEDSPAATALGGGSIVIHTKK